jgi:hypothetical protein
MRKIFLGFIAFLFSATTLAFSDVGSSHPNSDAIDYLARHGVVAGFSDEKFKPNQAINRAELAKMVVKARGVQPDTRKFRNCFLDVNAEWFAMFVCQAKHQEWISGYDNGNFQPSTLVNRAEASKIIFNTLGAALSDVQKFPDTDDSDWFAVFADTIKSRNLLDSESFEASREITRGEIAEIIFRILIIKSLGADAFDASMTAGFDFQKTPADIIANSVDFPGTAIAPMVNFSMSDWLVSSGVWHTKPIIQFNGRSYEFATPQDYAAVLETIQQHFRVIDNLRLDTLIDRLVGEFERVFPFFETTTPTTIITPTSVLSILSITNMTVGHAADFTNINLSDEAAVAARGGPSVRLDNTLIYTGYESLPPLNKNPIMVSFTNGTQDWVRKDYETSIDESVGYGLLWADTETLFAVFTSRGIEENINRDFRRFAKNGWLSEYGDGEGEQVAVIAKIDPQNGDVLMATFLSARRGEGETNSLTVKELQMNGENLVVSAECWQNLRRIDRQPMDKKPSADNSPFDYTIEFISDLKTAVRAEAPGFGK